MKLGTKQSGGTLGTTPLVKIHRDDAQKTGKSVSITISEPAKRMILQGKAQRNIVFGYDETTKEIGIGFLTKALKDSGHKAYVLKTDTKHNLGISFIRQYGYTAEHKYSGTLKATDCKDFPFKAVIKQTD